MFFATLLFQPQIEKEPITISMYVFIWGPSSDLAFVYSETKLQWSTNLVLISQIWPLFIRKLSPSCFLFSCIFIFLCNTKYLKIINSLVLLGFAFKNSNTLWTRNIPPTSFMWEHRNAREKERLSQISSELLQIASEAKQRVKWILRTPRQSSSYRKSFLTTWHYYLLE